MDPMIYSKVKTVTSKYSEYTEVFPYEGKTTIMVNDRNNYFILHVPY